MSSENDSGQRDVRIRNAGAGLLNATRTKFDPGSVGRSFGLSRVFSFC